jgi:tetratricopeptide (TPR) repeat protein
VAESKDVQVSPVTEPIAQEVILSGDEKIYLIELIKTIKTRIARGEFSEARARIIEGLSIEKFNKDLNCLLASLYEKGRDYKKAELIYKDLILMNDTDPELYLKLGFALSIQGKYEIAYEIYKRLLSLDEHSTETVDMLANIGHQLGHHAESNEYAYIFLKKNPHNTDILYLTAINHINLEERDAALASLKKIRSIDPYNNNIQELIKKIELELEMENNFKAEE